MKKEEETLETHTHRGREKDETDTEIHKETDWERNETYSRNLEMETHRETHKYRGGYTDAKAHIQARGSRNTQTHT